MFGRKKHDATPRGLQDRGPQGAEGQTYPLEAIMALQKALERGLEHQEPLPPKYSEIVEERERNVGRDARSGFMMRLTNPLGNLGRRLKHALQLVFAFRKQSRRTSAR
jgi:hypothetical protein